MSKINLLRGDNIEGDVKCNIKQSGNYFQRGVHKILIPIMSLFDRFIFFKKKKELRLINLRLCSK